MVLLHLVWVMRKLDNFEEHSGMDEATSEDLAFLNRSSREPDGVGPEDCLRKLRPVDSENTPLLPQRVKSSSVSGSALLTSAVRNHARSAFKRFSHPLPFAYTLRGATREWCEKSDWSKDIPE